MKVTKEQAAENRERILDAAGELFRERGIDGIGLADLMKSAGLTHGGFYNHFKSKEDLVSQTCTRIVTRAAQRWENTLAEAPGDPVDALAEHYLTRRHRNRTGKGCPMAALGADVARQPLPVRHAVTEELRPFLQHLSGFMPAESKSQRRQQALASYASLVGALVLARAVDDLALSDEFLEAAAASLPRAPKRKSK